jgi:large subunit ribosomal protein L6
MSRIGKKPVTIDKSVKISRTENVVEVTGPKGTLKMEMLNDIAMEIKSDEIIFTRTGENKKNRALHGLYRALLQNMVTGVKDGYTKKLELVGIGYKAEIKNNFLVLQLGYSHPIVFLPPADVKIETPAATQIVISGIDKQIVGQVAAKIRSFREPEPYKGKGVKYENEKIRRKAGKTAAK